MTGNVAEFDSTDGFFLATGADQNTLSSNTANFNGNGFELDQSSNNSLTSNVAKRNSQEGFELSGGSNQNTLTSNTANANNGGFFASGSNTNNFSKNTANNNLGSGGAEGFLILGDGNTVDSNTANNNVLSGFDITGANNHITGNTAANDGRSGFVISGDKATITGNTATGNGQERNESDDAGFIFFNLTNGTVSGNTAKNNEGNGLNFADSTSGNTVSGNTATDNGAADGDFDLFDGSTGAARLAPRTPGRATRPIPAASRVALGPAQAKWPLQVASRLIKNSKSLAVPGVDECSSKFIHPSHGRTWSQCRSTKEVGPPQAPDSETAEEERPGQARGLQESHRRIGS